jgi:hypothetical protein
LPDNLQAVSEGAFSSVSGSPFAAVNRFGAGYRIIGMSIAISSKTGKNIWFGLQGQPNVASADSLFSLAKQFIINEKGGNR